MDNDDGYHEIDISNLSEEDAEALATMFSEFIWSRTIPQLNGWLSMIQLLIRQRTREQCRHNHLARITWRKD